MGKKVKWTEVATWWLSYMPNEFKKNIQKVVEFILLKKN